PEGSLDGKGRRRARTGTTDAWVETKEDTIRRAQQHSNCGEIMSPEMQLNEKQQVSTKAAPAAIGPYSQAVRIGGFLYTSGQVALDPASGVLVTGGVAEQTVRVIENLKAVLAAGGASLAQVVKTTVFLK